MSQGTTDLRFGSNEDFWDKVLFREPRLSTGISIRWVELVGFQLIDWFPRTPGLFHRPGAEQARSEAEHYVEEVNGIEYYVPQGKMHMLDGGIGSVRFKPITINDSDYWMCTATSDNNCHSGVPVAIPNEIMQRVNFRQLYRVTGQVRFLPEIMEPYLSHMTRIPQVYVDVDNVSPLGNENRPTVQVTPMVFFTSEGARFRPPIIEPQNVTYVTCRADSPHEIASAVEWLEWYVNRYEGQIVTNFDQQEPTFANAPFSLQNIMSGRLRVSDLQQYHIENASLVVESIEHLHAESIKMTNINVTLGDGTIIHGDFVVANSIKNSFNKAESADIPNGLKADLKELAKAVASMSESLPAEVAKQAARDLDTLTAEATSSAPRKEWWQLSVEGLKKAAKDVGEIGKPVLELAARIVAVLVVLPS